MPVPTNREEFQDYCLRKLGWPVIQINIDDDQVADRIDDALQYFREFHFDGVEKIYGIHPITQEDIDNRYLSVDPLILGIVRIFPLSDSISNFNMFDLRYQLRLNELYDFTSASYVNYTITMQHLRTLELLFVGQTPIRFNRHSNKLFIDWGWGTSIVPGDVAIMEAYRIMDPDVYPDIWNDMFLKQYATQLIKRQWGENIKKLGNVQLPGGVFLNGKQIYDEAVKEIKNLEDRMVDTYSGPLEWQMG